MHAIITIKAVREALARAEQLGAADIEEACTVAAQALGIPVEAVRDVPAAGAEPASEEDRAVYKSIADNYFKSATSERDAEDAADMFWDDNDPERMAHSIHDIVEERDGDCGLEVGQEITVQCAKRMPNVTVRITKIRDEDGGGEVDYETIDAQREQSEKRSGEGQS